MSGSQRFPSWDDLIALHRTVYERMAQIDTVSSLGLPDKVMAPSLRRKKGKANVIRATELLGPSIATLRAFSWLQGRDGYRAASEIFTSSQRNGTAQARVRAEIHFLDSVLVCLSTVLFSELTGWLPQSVPVARKRAANKHAGELLDDLRHVSLRSPEDSATLRRLLLTFKAELDQRKKRDYAGPKALERFVLQNLALSLLGKGALTSARIADILENLADAFHLPIGNRTAQRYVEAAQEEHRELLERIATELVVEYDGVAYAKIPMSS